MMAHSHDGVTCKCQPNALVSQTLDEMEFERGIWSAALYNELDRLKTFISNGHTNDRDNSGYTALHYAARNGFYEACQILINAGAEIDAVTHGGATPLHRAVMMGHSKIVNLLISKNAKLNLQDSDGQTILHRAVLKGDQELIKLINARDLNLKEIQDRNGRTAVDLINEKFPHLSLLL